MAAKSPKPYSIMCGQCLKSFSSLDWADAADALRSHQQDTCPLVYDLQTKSYVPRASLAVLPDALGDDQC